MTRSGVPLSTIKSEEVIKERGGTESSSHHFTVASSWLPLFSQARSHFSYQCHFYPDEALHPMSHIDVVSASVKAFILFLSSTEVSR